MTSIQSGYDKILEPGKNKWHRIKTVISFFCDIEQTIQFSLYALAVRVLVLRVRGLQTAPTLPRLLDASIYLENYFK